MDFAPEATKNNCLTNALNATLVTMNGNELQLQNDMGNVETKAKLPDGFIPLGTTELGGIIYIVSYNPKDKKSQIGSFPSPQRYSSTESKTKDKTWNISRENTEQILLSDQIFNPGDQFVYVVNKFKEATITDPAMSLLSYLYDQQEGDPEDHFIKASVGLLTEDNKVIKLYDVNNYITTDKANLEYQTITCKFSGKLVLVLQKVLYYPNVSTKCLVEKNVNEEDIYKLYINTSLYNLHEEEFNPVGLQIKLTFGNQTKTKLIWQNIKEFITDLDLTTLFGIKPNINTPTLVNIEVTPISSTMFNDTPDVQETFQSPGKDENGNNIIITDTLKGTLLKSCSYSTSVDLSKVNSGLVEMPIYNYLVADKHIYLNYGFNIFTKQGQEHQSTLYNIYCINNNSVQSIYEKDKVLDNKETGNLNLELEKDNLYVMYFNIVLHIEKTNEDKKIPFYRWLYTNTLFNQYSGKYNDFNEIIPNLHIQSEANLQYSSQAIEVKQIVPGLYLKKGILTEQEATATEMYNLETTLSKNTITLTSDYANIVITGLTKDETSGKSGTFTIKNTKEIQYDNVDFSYLNNVIYVNGFKDEVSNVEAQKIFSIKSFDVDKPLVFCPMSYANYISQDIPSDNSLSVEVRSEDGSDKSALEVWSSKYIGNQLSSFDELTIGRVGYAITLSPELKKGINAVGISEYSSLYKNTGNNSNNHYERIYCIFAPAIDGANSVSPCLIKISDAESLDQTEQNSGYLLLKKVFDTIYTYRDISISGFQQANPIDYKTQCVLNGVVVDEESIQTSIELNDINIDIKIGETNLSTIVDQFNKTFTTIDQYNVTINPEKKKKIPTNIYRKYVIPSTLMQYTPEISEYVALDPNGVNAYFFNGISKDSEGNKTQPYRFIDHKTMNKLTINNSTILSELKLNDTYYFNPSIINEIRLVEDLPYLVFNANTSNLVTFQLSGGETHPVLTRYNNLEFIYKKNANRN